MAHNHRQSTVSSHTSGWAAREARIAEVAEAQHGQLTLTQFARAGLSDGGVRHRLRTGRLHRVHPEVYSLGRPPVNSTERRMAAILACGEGAALSHATAGDQLDLRASASALIDVTSPTGAGRRLSGIRAHRSRTLRPGDIVLIDGIPTTSCARTLLDLAAILSRDALATHLEGRMIHPDFLWRSERLIAETDGWETHGTRQAFEHDRARDQLLACDGFAVVRVTWRQLEAEPDTVVRTLRAALAVRRRR